MIAADAGRQCDNGCNGNDGDDDDDDEDNEGRANENEVDAVMDKGVSHVFLPKTRRTIALFLSLTHLNIRSHRDGVPIDCRGTSRRVSPAKLPRPHLTISL